MNFDMVVFEEVDEADMDWEEYEPYSKYDENYFDDPVVKASSQLNTSPIVQDHFNEMSFSNYLEMIINFQIAFFDQTLTTQSEKFANCSNNIFTSVIHY